MGRKGDFGLFIAWRLHPIRIAGWERFLHNRIAGEG